MVRLIEMQFRIFLVCCGASLSACSSRPAVAPAPPIQSERASVGKTELAPFTDTYRLHRYHLTKTAPLSDDGVFRLLSIEVNGDLRLHINPDEADVVIRRSESTKEITNTKMPLRLVTSDYETQSADFEWLTTN